MDFFLVFFMSIGTYGFVNSGGKVNLSKVSKVKKKESSSSFSVSEEIQSSSSNTPEISVETISPILSFPQVSGDFIDEKSFKWCNEQIDDLKKIQEMIVSGNIRELNIDDKEKYINKYPKDHIVSQIEIRKRVEIAKIKMSL